ncbi:protoporphyrinogen oxidase [Wenyingzhuangia fucanilytica]|uniref:Protoporphyrinogen IX dehydrogenase [quinone] n=1 Tax=Wenyingzhuangia fucanilytica TaxID=1790137 RepID=A0A1B1Y399_9FLAO|nr:menaquinone-dependent protoporphyrinogen IX dehydrogenase [Wenyingzhuangia fucanilytica]ANW95243.1 protoporphyrinogen oxidase [Wenyingzhuangia fucanilytica]
MADKIGIIYASVDGHTKKICEFIQDQLSRKNYNVELIPADTIDDLSLDYKILIIGSSIRYGKHHKSIYRLINQYKIELSKIKTAFFSVNLVARNKDKNSADTNPYLIKFLNEITWKPTLTDVFGGKLDYTLYSFFDKLMIKLIMKITHGPIHTDRPIEYTDWKRVDEFCTKISEL